MRKFTGPLIPMGAEISYLPSNPGDLARLDKYGDKTLSGLFIGYKQRAGGSWSGDVLVIDWEEIDTADSAREVHVKTVAAKEIITTTPFRFPLSEGICRQPSTRSSQRHRTKSRNARVWDDLQEGAEGSESQENNVETRTPTDMVREDQAAEMTYKVIQNFRITGS